MIRLPIRILLTLLCAAMILALPFAVSSPTLLDEAKLLLEEDGGEEEGEELDFGRMLFSSARAEEDDLIIEETEDGVFSETVQWELPLDFSAAPAPREDSYTENGYEDETIRVTVETQEESGVIWHVAHIRIASPTQLRTGIAGDKLTSKRTRTVSTMAKMYNAVIALNGDDFVMDPQKTTFEYRMTGKIRSKTNRMKDILVIDENADFHLFRKSEGLKNYKGKVINAFTFGPALVVDGELIQVDTGYGYNPNGLEPRAAIGQTGPLQYVFVIAEGRGESAGVTHQQLADKMYALGCVQAFNLDGGNSAEMVFNGTVYKGMPGGDERGISDIIYFATAVPEE